MNVSISFELFRDTWNEPAFYWVYISTTYDVDEVMLKNGGNVPFVASTNENGNYVLDVLLQSCDDPAETQCPVVHALNLGTLYTSGAGCALEINVLYANERVGGGLPKLSGATQATKPIELV